MGSAQLGFGVGEQQELIHGWVPAAGLECGRLLVLAEVSAGGAGQCQSAECWAAGASPTEIQ